MPGAHVQTTIVGALGRGLLRVTPFRPGKAQVADGFCPLHLGTIMRFGSLEFMSLGSGYDIVLLPPRDKAEPLPPSQCEGDARDIMLGEPATGDIGPGL